MTTTADDETVERAFEALLAGRPVPPSAGGLVAFAGAVRTVAERPARPSAELAELLANGLLAPRSSPSTRTAPTAGTTALPAAAPARRRRTRMFAPALLAKIASLSAVAKAATVTGVVVAGFSTAGFTGALPTPVQHGFATVVSSVTPLEVPDPGTTTSTEEPTAPPVTDPADPKSTDPTEAAPAGGAAATPSTFGQRVSGMAHQDDGKPGVDGAAVSSLAHERNQSRRNGSATPTTAATAPTATRTEDADDDLATDDHATETEHAAETGRATSTTSGKGSGHGGNGGHGSD